MKLFILFIVLLYTYADFHTKNKECGVLKAHFNDPTPAAYIGGQSDIFTQISITLDVAGTAKVEGAVSYYGNEYGGPLNMTVSFDLKDATLTTVATTGDFVPSLGWNTVDFTSFVAKGTEKTHLVYITLGQGFGYVIPYSGYIKYLPK